LRGDRSKTGIIQSRLDVKRWLAKLPSVDEVRPGRCVWCGAASRRPGASVTLWGHGLRERLLRGPLEADGEPHETVIVARRFVCQACGGVLLVVPRGVAARRHYAAAAMAWSLALFGVVGLPPDEVRRRCSPARVVGYDAAGRWPTLRRWAAAIRAGRLFGRAHIRLSVADQTARQIAARAAQVLAAYAPPTARGGPTAVLAFLGGAAMA
jgi:hypothetical protein